ncbi:hypothetical protein EOD41_08445 [Mucilaginibacter limnophilus]|uniref:Uncharacterized protein n=1 Tax=Mucilaginibacter limnophilus TaxID=1932778 RepID=A0A437MWB7_9SPHI|nr:hypothetical protein [Mucilaginibacter limnophilus]RVU01971.1 hypothetical protein EOD41_08445 [Mucilaginibacter limnophilus]
MKYLLFCLIILSGSVKLKAQSTQKDSVVISEYENYHTNVGKARALHDISNNTIKLLLIGGMRPKHFDDQERFERKYDITYYTYGCVFPRGEKIRAYNAEVFKYLDNKYGKDWRKETRPDVIGL